MLQRAAFDTIVALVAITFSITQFFLLPEYLDLMKKHRLVFSLTSSLVIYSPLKS